MDNQPNDCPLNEPRCWAIDCNCRMANTPQEMPPDNKQAINSDTEKCNKCSGRTALVSGEFYWNADQEPYSNGKQEVAENRDGTSWIHGYVCDDCESIQGLWNED